MMIVKKKIYIMLIALTLISLISGTGAYIARDKFSGASVNRVLEVYEAKKFINVLVYSMPVKLLAWDGDEIKIECVSDLPLIIEETEEEFTVKQDDGFAVSIFTKDIFNYSLTVFLPAEVEYSLIAVKGGGGDLEINSLGLNAKKTEVVAKNGDIEIFNANSDFEIKTTSGNINVNYFSLLLPSFIETERGDIVLNLPDYSEVYLNFSTITGALSDNFPVNNSGEKTSNDKETNLTVKTNSGDLYINKVEADVILY